MIATDGGLLEAPHELTRVQLSPGERAEIVAAFAAGERVVLRSFEPDLGTNFFEERFTGGDDSFDLLQIRAAGTLNASPAGWKDTIYAQPGKTLRLLVPFGDYSDPATPYMFHCHVLEHEDRGMMGQHVLTEPGTSTPDLRRNVSSRAGFRSEPVLRPDYTTSPERHNAPETSEGRTMAAPWRRSVESRSGDSAEPPLALRADPVGLSRARARGSPEPGFRSAGRSSSRCRLFGTSLPCSVVRRAGLS